MEGPRVASEVGVEVRCSGGDPGWIARGRGRARGRGGMAAVCGDEPVERARGPEGPDRLVESVRGAVHELQLDARGLGRRRSSQWAKPIFFAKAGDPEYRWTDQNGWAKGDIRYQGEPIPMPAGAKAGDRLRRPPHDRDRGPPLRVRHVAGERTSATNRRDDRQFDLTGSGVAAVKRTTPPRAARGRRSSRRRSAPKRRWRHRPRDRAHGPARGEATTSTRRPTRMAARGR